MSAEKKCCFFRQRGVGNLPRLAWTHLLLRAVDDDQVGSASDAVLSAVLPVHFEAFVLSKGKQIARGVEMDPFGGTAAAFHWKKESSVSVGVWGGRSLCISTPASLRAV